MVNAPTSIRVVIVCFGRLCLSEFWTLLYNSLLIWVLDIANVSSERRNPILANVMAQLDYMEKRGSGLTHICNETKALEGYTNELKPLFKSTPTQFQTIIYASPTDANVGDHDGD